MEVQVFSGAPIIKISQNHKEEVVDEKENQKTPAFLKNKLSRFNQQKKNEPKDCYLGLGPKFVNSIVIGLNEDDDIHVKKSLRGWTNTILPV